MRSSRLRTTLLVSLSAAVVAVPTALAPAAGAAPKGPSVVLRGELPKNTAAQIDALARAKLARTATQKKVDSRLLAAADLRAGRTLAGGVGKVDPGVAVDKSGRTDVELQGKVTSDLLRRITASGATVRNHAGGTVLVNAPLAQAQALATLPGVSHVGVPFGSTTATMDPAPQRSKADTAARLAARLKALQRNGIATSGAKQAATAAASQGSVVSEGDTTHGAAAVRASRKVAGAGVTVGVLSDGVDSLAASIASGDLPADTRVLPGQAGDGDEGTAMMEIVHDVAPTADIVFATANPTAAQFAQNIRDLRAAGADIIVDDVVYFAESPFQDGPVAQAVIDVTDDGALYFSSAGNEQNVDDLTAGNYEGDYVPSGRTIGKFAGKAHDFDPGPGVQVLDPVSDDSAGVPAILQWADPSGKSKDDYDLYAVDATGNVLAFSNDTQDGDDDPFEGFYVPDGTAGLAVVKFKGANRYFQVTPFRGRFADGNGLKAYNTPGVTRGHSAVPAAYSVAAVPAAVAFPREIAPGVPNPTGPYPGLYTRTQQSETFTSDGPRRVFFTPDGRPITPGNFTSTGGELRLKPDLAAADGVQTSVPDFERFYGTSASAPHAAAIAALALSGNPGITPAEVREAIGATAIDIEAAGRDRDTGVGIVMANRLVNRLGATPQPLVRAGQPTVTPAGDGDQYLEPGESASVVVPVTNEGDANAQSVSVRLTTTTPGVTITPANRSVGSVAVGATKSTAPFTVKLAADYDPGVPVQLTARVSFVGALSPQSGTLTVQTGQPSDVVTDLAYTGPAIPIPDASDVGASVSFTATDLGRIADLSFSVDGTTCSTADGATTVGIDHTFDGDLVATLTAPGGQQVVLFDGVGGSGNNFCQTVLTDSAATSIQSTANVPFTGSYGPAQPLSPLKGTVADGTWTFTVVDTAAFDTGSLRAVSLHLRPYLRTP
ncbi:S8 family serine peptidase [Angustibacter peucedani]